MSKTNRVINFKNELCTQYVEGFNREYAEMLDSLQPDPCPGYWWQHAPRVSIPWKTESIALEAWNTFAARGEYSLLRHLVDLFFYAHKAGDYGKITFECPINPLIVEVLTTMRVIIEGREHWLLKLEKGKILLNHEVFGTVDPWEA